jgi:hypothetical protein
MVLQPTILIMARPGNEYLLDAYIKPFTMVQYCKQRDPKKI